MATEQAEKARIDAKGLQTLIAAAGIDERRGGAAALVSGYFRGVTTFTPQPDPGQAPRTYYTISVEVSGGVVKISADPGSSEWHAAQQMKQGDPVYLLSSASVDKNGKLKADGQTLHILKTA